MKKQRNAQRAAFIKAHNASIAKCERDCPKKEKIAAFQLLDFKATELDAVRVRYNEELFKSDSNDDDIAKDVEGDDDYKTL